MARVTTSKGAAELRPMLMNDELLLSDLADLEGQKDNASNFYSVKGRMLRALDAATVSAPWEGGFGVLPAREVLTAYVLWNNATDEEALPPDNGTSSETPPQPGS